MEYTKFSYRPLNLEESITSQDYIDYIERPGHTRIIQLWAIDPLEEAMKRSKREEFEFDDKKITKSFIKKQETSWKKVYDSLLDFLEIRADDSKAFNMDGVKPFEGIGYCILIPDLRAFTKNAEKNSISKSAYEQLNWPRMKKNESFPNEIALPEVDYKVVNEENLRNILIAKRFCSGLEKEVVEPFKEANIKWFERETSYSKDKLPTTEQSPITIKRDIEEGRYIAISLIRAEKPQYQQIISHLNSELDDLENDVVLPGYKTKRTKEGAYVNIKNVKDRLSWERLEQDKFIDVQGKYEIAP